MGVVPSSYELTSAPYLIKFSARAAIIGAVDQGLAEKCSAILPQLIEIPLHPKEGVDRCVIPKLCG